MVSVNFDTFWEEISRESEKEGVVVGGGLADSGMYYSTGERFWGDRLTPHEQRLVGEGEGVTGLVKGKEGKEWARIIEYEL